MAGDLVRNGPGDFGAHRGARGLSQEKSLVTGLAAAVEADRELGSGSNLVEPLSVEPDEAHVALMKDGLRRARELGIAGKLLIS